MLRTGKEYLESVRDNRRVLCGGEWIDDITTHPKTCGYARQVAAFYDLHLDPEHQDLLTFTDEDGVRRARQWKLPRNKEDVVEKRRGPLVDLARKVCDLGDIEDLVRRADDERQKIIEKRDKPEYIKGQDVKTV